MEKTISSNQASLILSIFTIALKLSALPTIMFTYSGNDCYVACAIALAIDFICTIIIVNIMHKHPDHTFHQFLKEGIGKIATIIIEVVLLIYFLMKVVIVIQELHDYFIATLFEELNPILFIVVISLLLFFCSTKNFRTIGRVAQMIFWPTLIGVTFTLIFPIEDIQVEKLLPILEQGPHLIYKSIARTTFAFGDFMILLPLMGQVALHRKSKKQILIYMFSTINFILNFFVVFVGSFGKYAMSQTLALGELPLHNSTPATIGKLEWLTIIVWTIILLVDIIILVIACREVFDNIFTTCGKKRSSIIISSAITIIAALTYLRLETIIEIAITPAFSSISGGIQLLLVILLVVCNARLNSKQKRDIPHKVSKTPKETQC